MSPACCLTMAAALALLSATPVFARGPAQHLAPRMAPQMFRAPVLAGKAAAKMAPAPQITFKQTPKIAPAPIRVAPIHVGSRIVHLRPDPARRHGRREAFIALGAPFYAAGPVQVVQQSVEYVPVERPLVPQAGVQSSV